MKRVIELVIAELEGFRVGCMCNISLELYDSRKITRQELAKFRRLIYDHKPEGTEDFIWWHLTEYGKRIDFLKDLLTKI